MNEIRAFLESLGYKTNNGADTPDLWSISIGEYPDNWICFSPWMRKINQAENCKLALNHYLSIQLGVDWRDMFRLMEHYYILVPPKETSVHPFSAQDSKNIRQAIAYLKSLESACQE